MTAQHEWPPPPPRGGGPPQTARYPEAMAGQPWAYRLCGNCSDSRIRHKRNPPYTCTEPKVTTTTGSDGEPVVSTHICTCPGWAEPAGE